MSRGHVRRQGKGSWELKYDIGLDAETGKRQTRYVTFRGTKKDAEKELTRLLNQADDGSHVDISRETLAQFAEHWMINIAPIKAKSDKTLERYRELIEGHILPKLGNVRLQQLKGSQIDKLYQDLRINGRRDGKGGLSEQTVIHIHRRLSALLNAAITAGKLRTNPMHRALAKPASKTSSEERKIIRVLDGNERKALLSALLGTPYYMPSLLALGTGLRRGEVLGLRWSDINLEDGELTVSRSLSETKRSGLKFKAPKSPHSRRTIKLPQSLSDALRTHKSEQAQHFMKTGLRPEFDLAFPSELGGAKSPDDFSWKYGQAVKKSGLEGVTFHSLRHTHITDLLRSGKSIKAISARAGHKDPTVTLTIYSHVMPGDDQELANIAEGTLLAVFS